VNFGFRNINREMLLDKLNSNLGGVSLLAAKLQVDRGLSPIRMDTSCGIHPSCRNASTSNNTRSSMGAATARPSITWFGI